jgi:hypothetical protein
MSEIWKPIKGYEDLYEVSNTGRVRRIRHKAVIGKTNPTLPQREKKPHVNQDGYAMVGLYRGQTQKHIGVHRLVAMAFIPNPENLPQVNHKDEDKTNNHVDNLEWCTNEYNSRYGTRSERIGKANKNGKKSKPIIGKKDDKILQFPSIAEASRTLKIVRENIVAALKGRRKDAGGYIWEYLY